MKCANCIYYESDVCYKKGARVSYNNNICEHFIHQNNEYEDKLNQ